MYRQQCTCTRGTKTGKFNLVAFDEEPMPNGVRTRLKGLRSLVMCGVKCMHVTEVPVENCRNPVSADRMRIENDMADDRAIRLYRGRMSRTCIHYMCLRVSYL